MLGLAESKILVGARDVSRRRSPRHRQTRLEAALPALRPRLHRRRRGRRILRQFQPPHAEAEFAALKARRLAPNDANPAPLHPGDDRRAEGRAPHLQHDAFQPEAVRRAPASGRERRHPHALADGPPTRLHVRPGAARASGRDGGACRTSSRPRRWPCRSTANAPPSRWARRPFLNDLADLLLASGAATPTLRIFVSAGAPIPRALVAKARRALDAAVLSAWGMSENGAVTTTRVEDSEEKVTTTDGCPLPGMEVRVVDAAGKVVPAGDEGRLQVRGCSNFVGYLKRPSLARGRRARVVRNRRYRAHGRRRLHPHRRPRQGHHHSRRRKHSGRTRSKSLMFRHPAVAAVAVVGYPDARLGERACAFVVPRRTRRCLRRRWSPTSRRRRWRSSIFPSGSRSSTELPRTPSGKIQKFKLREVAKAQTGVLSGSIPCPKLADRHSAPPKERSR